MKVEGRAPDPDRGSIGDRVERAIESRTDTAEEIERGSLRRTVFWLTVTGISLYLVAPSLIEVLGSWRSLGEINPLWFPALAALQLGSLASLWWLQKLALPSAPVSGVIESQLAGNALSKIAPGGGALGGALQYRMLVERGVGRGRAGTAITAVNLLTFAIVLALPVLALPLLLTGSVDDELQRTALLSLAVFAVLAIVGVVALAADKPLQRVGRAIQAVRNRLRRNSPPSRGLPDRLTKERDRLVAALGPNARWALLATVGRWAFDYAILLAALAAVGSYPQPGVVLLAFCAAQVLAQIPVTPGGLGFVEAGLTATLALAGVGAGDALLATFAYRLFTYWLPLPLGVLGIALHRRRLATEAAADQKT